MSKKHNYHLLVGMYITRIQALSAANPRAVELPPVDWRKVNERVESKVEEMVSRAAKIGDGVTPEQQSLFNDLARCFPNCRWGKNKEMLVEDAVIVPPYDSASVTGPKRLVDRILLVCADLPPLQHSHHHKHHDGWAGCQTVYQQEEERVTRRCASKQAVQAKVQAHKQSPFCALVVVGGWLVYFRHRQR